MSYIPHKCTINIMDNLNDVFVMLEHTKENVADYDDTVCEKIFNIQMQVRELKNFIINNHIEG